MKETEANANARYRSRAGRLGNFSDSSSRASLKPPTTALRAVHYSIPTSVDCTYGITRNSFRSWTTSIVPQTSAIRSVRILGNVSSTTSSLLGRDASLIARHIEWYKRLQDRSEIPQNRYRKIDIGLRCRWGNTGPTKNRASIHQSNLESRYHDIENQIRNQSNATILCDSTCKRSWPQQRRRRRLSSVSNWLCSGHSRQAGGSLGPGRRASRATLRSPQIPSQTVSCQ